MKRMAGRPTAPDALASKVAQRLDELRALDDLTHYLHRKR